MVVKGIDHGKMETISKIAIPLEVGTAMAAEVEGVCVLTGILHIILRKCFVSKTSIHASIKYLTTDGYPARQAELSPLLINYF